MMTREELEPYLRNGIDAKSLTDEQVSILSEYVETVKTKHREQRAEREAKRGTVRGPCVVCGINVLHGEAITIDRLLHCRKHGAIAGARVAAEEHKKRLRRLNGEPWPTGGY